MKPFTLLAAVSACLPLSVIAQTERDLDSHVHGSASLNVAIVDSSVFVELKTPWNNLVGFEHVPRTDEQHKLVDSAVAQLNEPTQLLAFDGGNCTLSDLQIESSMLQDSHDDEHHDTHEEAHSESHDDEHHDTHEEAHGESHDDEHTEEDDETHEHGHDDGDAHDEQSGDTHTTALVMYSFECENINELDNIDLLLFSVWTGFEELDVQLIGEKGQALVELNAQNPTLNVAQVR